MSASTYTCQGPISVTQGGNIESRGTGQGPKGHEATGQGPFLLSRMVMLSLRDVTV